MVQKYFTQATVVGEQDASFEGELRAIGAALPQRRQTLLFSATLTRSLAALQAAALHGAFQFRVRRCIGSGAWCSIYCHAYVQPGAARARPRAA